MPPAVAEPFVPTAVRTVRFDGGTLVRVDSGSADDGPKKAPNGQLYDDRFIASTEMMASDYGIIPCAAWDLTEFVKRPRFISNHDLWAHGGRLDEVVIGRVVSVGIETGLPTAQVGMSGRALVAYVRYMPTAFGQQVQVLYREGGLDDVSVRWDGMTAEYREPTDSERLQNPDVQWIATKVSLLELSAVLLGADDGAQITRARTRAAREKLKLAGHNIVALEEWVTRRAAERAVMAELGENEAIAATPETVAASPALISDEMAATAQTAAAEALAEKERIAAEQAAADAELERLAAEKAAADAEEEKERARVAAAAGATRAIDASAVQDCVVDLKAALGALDQVLDAFGPIHAQINDSITELNALMMPDGSVGDIDDAAEQSLNQQDDASAAGAGDAAGTDAAAAKATAKAAEIQALVARVNELTAQLEELRKLRVVSEDPTEAKPAFRLHLADLMKKPA
jgi:hypothetical protein